MRTNITELDSNDFYGMLLKLPKLDESGKISERIYREIIDFDKKIFGDSENYKKFMEVGEVLTSNHDGKSYNKASASYFTNSSQLNISNYHIMKTPLRNGAFEVFPNTFGVQKFEERYKVKKDSIKEHPQNKEF